MRIHSSLLSEFRTLNILFSRYVSRVKTYLIILILIFERVVSFIVYADQITNDTIANFIKFTNLVENPISVSIRTCMCS